MRDVTVYGIPGSPYVRAVLMELEEKSVPYNFSRMAPMESKQPAYLARHPFGRIRPSSMAISACTRRRRSCVISMPSSPVSRCVRLSRAPPRGWTRWSGSWIGTSSGRSARRSASTGRGAAFGMPTDEAVVIAAIPKAKICFAEIARLLGDKAYLACDAMTIADLMLAPHMEFISLTPKEQNYSRPIRLWRNGWRACGNGPACAPRRGNSCNKRRNCLLRKLPI